MIRFYAFLLRFWLLLVCVIWMLSTCIDLIVYVITGRFYINKKIAEYAEKIERKIAKMQTRQPKYYSYRSF